MEESNNWQAAIEQLYILLTFIGRPIIQQQLIAFAGSVAIAWVLSDGVWYISDRRLHQWLTPRLSEQKQAYTQYVLWFIKLMSFPLLILITMEIAYDFLVNRGMQAGFLQQLSSFVFLVLIYRFFIAWLYIILGEDYMHRYHFRLMMPLFVLIVSGWIFNRLIDLSALAGVIIARPFGNQITLGAVFTAIVALYFWIYLSQAVQDFLQGVIAPRTHADPNAIEAGLTIGRYIVIGVGVMIVAWAFGVDLTTLGYISGGLSVGIGFGLQQIVANFLSGIWLLFEQSLRPGDVIDVDGELGVVQSLSIRATTMRTLNNVEVVVPNEKLLTSSVKTFTRSSRHVRILIPVGVSYDSDVDQIRRLLLDVARIHKDVRHDPAPVAFFKEFGDSSLNFHLAIWVNDPTLISRVSSELNFMIWRSFQEHNIEIPFPQRDLHIRSGLPPTPAAPPTLEE